MNVAINEWHPNALKKLLEYFNGTKIFAFSIFLFTPSGVVLPSPAALGAKISILYLKELELSLVRTTLSASDGWSHLY